MEPGFARNSEVFRMRDFLMSERVEPTPSMNAKDGRPLPFTYEFGQLLVPVEPVNMVTNMVYDTGRRILSIDDVKPSIVVIAKSDC
jgi:hypothetical protein